MFRGVAAVTTESGNRKMEPILLWENLLSIPKYSVFLTFVVHYCCTLQFAVSSTIWLWPVKG